MMKLTGYLSPSTKQLWNKTSHFHTLYTNLLSACMQEMIHEPLRDNRATFYSSDTNKMKGITNPTFKSIFIAELCMVKNV